MSPPPIRFSSAQTAPGIPPLDSASKSGGSSICLVQKSSSPHQRSGSCPPAPMRAQSCGNNAQPYNSIDQSTDVEASLQALVGEVGAVKVRKVGAKYYALIQINHGIDKTSTQLREAFSRNSKTRVYALTTDGSKKFYVFEVGENIKILLQTNDDVYVGVDHYGYVPTLEGDAQGAKAPFGLADRHAVLVLLSNTKAPFALDTKKITLAARDWFSKFANSNFSKQNQALYESLRHYIFDVGNSIANIKARASYFSKLEHLLVGWSMDVEFSKSLEWNNLIRALAAEKLCLRAELAENHQQKNRCVLELLDQASKRISQSSKPPVSLSDSPTEEAPGFFDLPANQRTTASPTISVVNEQEALELHPQMSIQETLLAKAPVTQDLDTPVLLAANPGSSQAGSGSFIENSPTADTLAQTDPGVLEVLNVLASEIEITASVNQEIVKEVGDDVKVEQGSPACSSFPSVSPLAPSPAPVAIATVAVAGGGSRLPQIQPSVSPTSNGGSGRRRKAGDRRGEDRRGNAQTQQPQPLANAAGNPPRVRRRRPQNPQSSFPSVMSVFCNVIRSNPKTIAVKTIAVLAVCAAYQINRYLRPNDLSATSEVKMDNPLSQDLNPAQSEHHPTKETPLLKFFRVLRKEGDMSSMVGTLQRYHEYLGLTKPFAVYFPPGFIRGLVEVGMQMRIGMTFDPLKINVDALESFLKYQAPFPGQPKLLDVALVRVNLPNDLFPLKRIGIVFSPALTARALLNDKKFRHPSSVTPKDRSFVELFTMMHGTSPLHFFTFLMMMQGAHRISAEKTFMQASDKIYYTIAANQHKNRLIDINLFKTMFKEMLRIEGGKPVGERLGAVVSSTGLITELKELIGGLGEDEPLWFHRDLISVWSQAEDTEWDQLLMFGYIHVVKVLQQGCKETGKDLAACNKMFEHYKDQVGAVMSWLTQLLPNPAKIYYTNAANDGETELVDSMKLLKIMFAQMLDVEATKPANQRLGVKLHNTGVRMGLADLIGGLDEGEVLWLHRDLIPVLSQPDDPEWARVFDLAHRRVIQVLKETCEEAGISLLAIPEIYERFKVKVDTVIDWFVAQRDFTQGEPVTYFTPPGSDVRIPCETGACQDFRKMAEQAIALGDMIPEGLRASRDGVESWLNQLNLDDLPQ